jgi:hypothetical protein
MEPCLAYFTSPADSTALRTPVHVGKSKRLLCWISLVPRVHTHSLIHASTRTSDFSLRSLSLSPSLSLRLSRSVVVPALTDRCSLSCHKRPCKSTHQTWTKHQRPHTSRGPRNVAGYRSGLPWAASSTQCANDPSTWRAEYFYQPQRTHRTTADMQRMRTRMTETKSEIPGSDAHIYIHTRTFTHVHTYTCTCTCTHTHSARPTCGLDARRWREHQLSARPIDESHCRCESQ